MNIKDAKVGQHVQYDGVANCGNRTGTVIKVIKSTKMVVIQWDIPTGPLEGDKFYRAFANNVRAV